MVLVTSLLDGDEEQTFQMTKEQLKFQMYKLGEKFALVKLEPIVEDIDLLQDMDEVVIIPKFPREENEIGDENFI